MKIVQEILDKEHYIDQILTQKEFEALSDFMVLSCPCIINGKKINLGLKVELFEDAEDEEN